MPLQAVEGCVQCNTPFQPNNELATVPTARRIAFDAERGRVWRVCSACQHWNLLGSEASAAALPELQARFGAGLIQSFEGIELSGIGTGLELIRLGVTAANASPSKVTPPPRDDVARDARRQQIDKRTKYLMGIAWFNMAAWTAIIVMNTLEAVIEYGARGMEVLAGGIAFSAVVLGGVSWYWRKHHPASPSLFLPWRQPEKLGKMANSGLILYLVYTVLNSVPRILAHGFSVPSMAGILVVFTLLLSLPTLTQINKGKINMYSAVDREVRTRGVRVLSAAASVALAIVVAWGHPILQALLATLLLAVEFGAMRWAKRKNVMNQILPSGKPLKLSSLNAAKIRYSWDTSTNTFTAHNLPDGSILVGADAEEVLRKTLKFFHHGLPPKPGRTEQAWQLMRIVGDAPGILAALEGYRQEQDGRISLFALPPTYRLALDFVLADRHGPRPELSRLKDAAESAAEVAGEAELLDAEMKVPIPEIRGSAA